jgi:MFS family permease
LINRKKFSEIFPGWWLNIVTGLYTGLGHGFYSYGVSVLFKPLSIDLGLNRAGTSWATGIGRLQGSAEAPITGWLSDRFGPKWVIVTGTVIAASGLLLMYFIRSAWAYYLVWGVITAIGMNLALTIAVDKALTDWFIRKRGLALGIRFVIIGGCGVIVLPIVSWLVTTYDWRVTCLIWSLVMFTGIPMMWRFVKQKRPEYYGLLPDGVKVESDENTDLSTMIDRGVEYAAEYDEVEFTLRQAMKTPAYWLITLSWIFAMAVAGAINTHCIPLLTDMGIDENVAGGMMAMMVFFTIPARFIAGVLADKVRKDRMQFLVAGTFILQALGIGIFLVHQSVVTVYVLLVLYGFGTGAPTPLRLTIGGRYFGRKAFASIQGTSMVLTSPVALLSPVYAGWVYDNKGTYIPAFTAFVVMILIAAVLMCLMRPPKAPEQVTEVNKFL